MSETQVGSDSVDPQVYKLVDYIWTEASGQLEDVLAVAVDSIKLEQLDKAEATLLSIKRLLQEGNMDKSKQGNNLSSCG